MISSLPELFLCRKLIGLAGKVWKCREVWERGGKIIFKQYNNNNLE